MVTDLPIHLDDVTERLRLDEVGDRLRGITETISETAGQTARRASRAAPTRRVSWPLLGAGLGIGLLIGLFVLFRSRRSTTKVGSSSPSETYART